MRRRSNRFFPKAVSAELWLLPWRIVALGLIGVAGFLWLSLSSWSLNDPSLNYAAQSAIRNWMGHRGALASDWLMSSFGLASVLIVLPIAALGFALLQNAPYLRLRSRLLFWIVCSLSLPAFFASLPVPQQSPLSLGFGGGAGAFVAGRIAATASAVQPSVLWPLMTLILGVVGLWSLTRACGMRWRDWQRQLIGSTVSRAKASSQTEFVPLTEDENDRRRFTSWTRRFSPRARALVKVSSPRKEFWMSRTAASAKPPAPLVASNPAAPPAILKQKMTGTRVVGIPATGTGLRSPFADWGQPASKVDVYAYEPMSAFKEAASRAEDEQTGDDRVEPFFGPAKRGGADSNGSHDEAERATAPFLRVTAKTTNAVHDQIRRVTDNLNGFRTGAASYLAQELASLRIEPPEAGAPDLDSHLPPLNLLTSMPGTSRPISASDPALMKRAAMLMDVLADFGVKGRMTGIYPGPVITLFELEPARGTKSSRIVGLADDIARSMSALSARVAVVPGRDAIGIELPNAKRELVGLRTMIESAAYENSEASLPLALGKSIGGEPIVVDLARMPHLLIAGTTGSGKSVGINTMILSLLYRLPPSQCNFIMIDPKMLELSAYDGIPHLLAPVVTDPKKAVAALKWTVKEMGSRYERMSKLGVRNIASYNAKVAAAILRGQPLRRTVQTGFDPVTGDMLEEDETMDAQSMPYIVVVIDEMADLMMVAGKDVEFAVQRLSQMARAAGIHLIMATQRPSVDVVTGTIKANFPSRISFQVTSKIDSRTIIGEQGAEQLLGAGDMLYMASGGRIIRAHGPFVTDDEVEAVARYLKAHGSPQYRDDILEDSHDLDEAPPRSDQGKTATDLYDQAVTIILKDRKPTTSYLQRRMGIGYNRAASLIERMEQEGILGAPSRTGRREILAELS